MCGYYLIYENGKLVETCRKSDWNDEQILMYAKANYENSFVRGVDNDL